jgi:hypothetical protein
MKIGARWEVVEPNEIAGIAVRGSTELSALADLRARLASRPPAERRSLLKRAKLVARGGREASIVERVNREVGRRARTERARG